VQDDVKYPFASRPDLPTLKIVLFAYDLRDDHPDENEWPDWKIGEEIEKEFAKILGSVRVMKNSTPNEKRDQHKRYADAAQKYLRSAKAIMDGVTRGIFPAKEGHLL
jgi:hypothetical protein